MAELEREEDGLMAEDAIDHTARQMAQDAKHQADRALDRIDANQETINRALNDQRVFEGEVRLGLKDLSDNQHVNYEKLTYEMHASNGQLHNRITSLIRALAFGSVAVIITMVGVALVMLFKVSGLG